MEFLPGLMIGEDYRRVPWGNGSAILAVNADAPQLDTPPVIRKAQVGVRGGARKIAAIQHARSPRLNPARFS